jgi:hypothetical protein
LREKPQKPSVLRPDGIFTNYTSLRELARRCGVQHSTLAKHTGHYSRYLGWRNRGQRHAWNWHAEEAHVTARSESPAEPGEHDLVEDPTADRPVEPEEAVASITTEQTETKP